GVPRRLRGTLPHGINGGVIVHFPRRRVRAASTRARDGPAGRRRPRGAAGRPVPGRLRGGWTRLRDGSTEPVRVPYSWWDVGSQPRGERGARTEGGRER